MPGLYDRVLPEAPDFADLKRDAALQPPVASLFTPEDALQIDALAANTTVTLTITGTMLSQRLEVLPFSFTFVPTTNRVLSTTRVSIGAGWLQSVRVIVTTGAPVRGSCFVWVRKARGVLSNAVVLATFVAGYITASADLYYPGALSAGPLDGQGGTKSVAGTTPALGAEVSETVPTGARWLLLSFRATLATSVAAGNRLPRLQIDDGAAVYCGVPAGAAVIPSSTQRFTWFPGGQLSSQPDSAETNMGLPIGLTLGPGHRIRTSTVAIAAGDQYSAVQYLVAEWLEGN